MGTEKQEWQKVRNALATRKYEVRKQHRENVKNTLNGSEFASVLIMAPVIISIATVLGLSIFDHQAFFAFLVAHHIGRGVYIR